MRPDPTSKQIQSVHTAFEIISVIQRSGGASLQDIADELDIARSTAHNHLSTLHSSGYVIYEGNTYRLGLRLLTNGMAARAGLKGRDVIKKKAIELASELERPVWWIVEEVGRGIFVERTGPTVEQAYGKVGKRSYLHVHAPGKAILATLSDETVDWILDCHCLPVHTKETITDEETLKEELETITEQGYAMSSGEAALGVKSVGAAFTGPKERVSAFGVFSYTHSHTSQYLDEQVVDRLKTASKEIDEHFSDNE